MIPALFSFVLFLFLALLGKAVIEALSLRFSILRGWLLAPSVGLAAVVLLTLNINQTGLPVKSFAFILTVVLAVFIGGVFWWKRPVLPWKQLAPFLGVALFSLLYTCWPMFLYGFRWFGYMNGDMAMYCLGATRVMNHGFFQIPTLRELDGTDYTQYMWFHAAAAMFRCGADIFLAWFASLTHFTPLRISMPSVAAVNLTQLWSAAALVLTRASNRRLALATSLFLAASPFYILGVMAQLLPQVGGLALLFGLCTLCMRPFPAGSRGRAILPYAALIAAFASAACIYYPEALPFGALAIVAYHAHLVIQRKERLSSVGAVLVPALVLLSVLARQGIFTAVGTILFSVSAGLPSGPVRPTAFDTVLDPSIFASLPGLEPYVGEHHDPWISIAIAVGIVLLLVAMFVGLRLAWKGQPAAFLLLIMLALGAQLFRTHAAFGLFKLAMYIQPMLLFTAAVATLKVLKKKWYLAQAAYIATTMATAIHYISSSQVGAPHSAVSLPGITNTEIRGLPLEPGIEMEVSAVNQAGATLYATESPGTNVKWADSNYFEGIAEMQYMPSRLLPLPARLGLTRDYLTPAIALRNNLASETPGHEVILGHVLHTRAPAANATQISYLGHIALDPWHHSNNTRIIPKHDDNYFSFDRIDTVRNYLVLLSTEQGGPSGAEAHDVSQWPVEMDLYHPSSTFYGIGRRLLFEVIRPTPDARLHIGLTKTLSGGGHTGLPEHAEVQGAVNQTLDFVGSGASNLTSAPIQFYERNGHYYLALDFGMDGNYFPIHKTGLLRMFHTDIPVDNRKMIGFARDVSLLTDSEYSALKRPRSVTSWPTDLLNPALEFSGIYEDGWVSNKAFVVLGQARAGEQIRVTGQVPGIGRLASGNGVRLLLNGTLIYQAKIKPGNFQIDYVFPTDSKENRVDFFFDQMNQLPAGDDRPVSAYLTEIAIANTTATASDK